MPLGHFLRHQVQVMRDVAVMDMGGAPSFDEYGQPITEETAVLTDVPAAIQERSSRERAALSQAGVAVSTHKIYCFPIEISTADWILHDPTLCSMSPDLPEGRYEIDAAPQGAGIGRHLELAATLVNPSQDAVAIEAAS